MDWLKLFGSRGSGRLKRTVTLSWAYKPAGVFRRDWIGKNKLIDIGLRWHSLDIEQSYWTVIQDIGWSCEVANPRQST